MNPSDPLVRTEEILASLTLEELAGLTAGVDMWHATGVERLGIRGMKVTDGPAGARGAHFVGTTSACLPCGSALGATWDTDLVAELGALVGVEAARKGADLLLAPTVNLHRSPLGGRNFESYSEDPHLAARLAVAYIQGVQSTGVGATVKHFAGNESEFERHTISTEMDERTLRELYLVPFEAAVTEARVCSVMTAYNRLGGIYCSEHPELMRILHQEWGFDGFVISDWWAVHSTVPTGEHGVDLEMPGPPKYLGPLLAAAVESGDLERSVVEGKARRILQTMERLGVLDRPEVPAEQSVDDPADRSLLRRAAAASVVLLTNNGILPLEPSRLRSLAVIGPNSDLPVVQGGGSAAVNPHHTVTIRDGLAAALGDAVELHHAPGGDASRTAPVLDARSRGALVLEYFDNRELAGDPVRRVDVATSRLVWLGEPTPEVTAGEFSARLSTTFRATTDGTHTFALVAAGQARLIIDGTPVVDMWDDFRPGSAFFGMGSEELRTPVELRAGQEVRLVVEYACFPGVPMAAFQLGALLPLPPDPIADAAALAGRCDAAVVVVGLNADWETEGEDRADMELPGDQATLIRRVAAANPNTVVLVNAGAPVTMDWADEVAAVAQIWYPGQEAGDAVADVLLGRSDPGGRLPMTIPARYEDNPTIGNYPGAEGTVRYAEGVFMGYRHYDRGPEPRFCFGHGLSYTTFEWSSPVTSTDRVGGAGTVDVTIEVTNTGPRAGSEVVQLYVAPPPGGVERPVRELKGFRKLHLAPGETGTASFELDRRAFASWQPGRGWVVQPGDYRLELAASSRAVRGSVTVHHLGDQLEGESERQAHDPIDP